MFPCPKCSAVPRIGAPMLIAPYWSFASNKSRAEGVQLFLWGATCKHSAPICSLDNFVPREGLPEIEEKWNVEAAWLLAASTKRWADHERRRFARSLGFPVVEVAGDLGLPEPAPAEGHLL